MKNGQEVRINAALVEFRRQCGMMGDRAAELAMDLSDATAEIAALRDKVAMLEKALEGKKDALDSN